jgi:hypothetical protein
MGPSRRLIWWWHSSRQLSVAFSVLCWLIVSSFRFGLRRDWVVEAGARVGCRFQVGASAKLAGVQEAVVLSFTAAAG